MISFNKKKALDAITSCYAVTSKQKFTHLGRMAHIQDFLCKDYEDRLG